ncbi:efflux RND transporter periplasmic adaptor subunit [Luteibacter aegosomatissinici]|uniref:efflux RND transporter periplasmic adaptor subunit n=1 Tax=Luteibacter aegosomatissinici TaxID=2911539 RepID=UPI001FF7BFAB|nr:efflux RND transporter periplasmic adaptor subunit [Luteibacter aegosomatissinici]UPG95770.1 efflux RND transporter periplasmic adaptor subunit [Luteibacter aegosomatissinici]
MAQPCRIALSGVTAATLLLLAACHPSANGPAASAPPDVGIASLVTRPIRAADEFNGRLEAIQSVEIRPRVSGYIDRIAYTEGAEVKAGDLLFVIDPRPYRDALSTAQAQLESARAASRLAQSRFARASKLVETHYISREDFDTSKATLDQSSADVHSAEAAVATASLNLAFTQVRAPVAGRAGRALLTLGNLARVDDSLLTTVVSQDEMYVYFDCDEHSYLRYGSGTDHSATAHIALADEDGFPRTARVDFLDNRLDPATGTIRARAIVPNPGHTLTPGLFARVRFESGAPVDTRLIDEKAVLTDQDRRYVYVVDGKGQAVRKEITIGRAIAGMRVVTAGLDDTDKVIVTGAQKVFYSGMPVHAVPTPPVAPAADATALATHEAH